MRRANALELAPVKEVVAGIHPTEVFEALLPALAVDADAGEIGRRKTPPDAQVGPADRLELLESVSEVDIRIMQSPRPEILVVAGQRRPVVRQNHAQPETADELGVSKVLDHVANRPLAGRLGPPGDFGRHRLEKPLEHGGGLLQHRDRVLVAEQAEKGRHVRRDLFGEDEDGLLKTLMMNSSMEG